MRDPRKLTVLIAKVQSFLADKKKHLESVGQRKLPHPKITPIERIFREVAKRDMNSEERKIFLGIPGKKARK